MNDLRAGIRNAHERTARNQRHRRIPAAAPAPPPLKPPPQVPKPPAAVKPPAPTPPPKPPEPMKTDPNSEFIIEKGVPIPKCSRPGRAGVRKYPLMDMEVGDSFQVECEAGRHSVVQQSLMTAARSYTKKDGVEWLFTSRAAKDQQSVRIWRVE